MQRERVLEAFVQPGRRRGIEQSQFFAQGQERRLRLLIGRLLVRQLKLAPPCGLLGLGQVARDVLPFVPLAAPALNGTRSDRVGNRPRLAFR